MYKERNKLQNYLHNKGIETKVNYPIPLHLQKASKYLNFKRGSLSNVEKQSKLILSLPIYSELKDEEVNYIIEKINKF